MEGEVLVVASKVRNYLKGQGVKMSSELVESLNGKVKAMLDDAAGRAKGNKRTTVKSQDV